jgi:hypothetical protein
MGRIEKVPAVSDGMRLEKIFSSKKWRQSAFGYFGTHVGGYSFWGFLPLMIEMYNKKNDLHLNIPF